jgi:subtilisin-like proprotein convertase family protein
VRSTKAPQHATAAPEGQRAARPKFYLEKKSNLKSLQSYYKATILLDFVLNLKKMLLRKLLWLSLLLLCTMVRLEAQKGKPQGLWAGVEEATILPVGQRYIRPKAYKTMSLDVAGLQRVLAVVPMENTAVGINSATFLDLPMPDGSFRRFRIVESPIMEAGLAEKFPEIETYAGVDIDDPSVYLRFDLTPQGFHAMISSPSFSTVFIDPYSFGGGDTRNYIVYHKRDFRPIAGKEMICDVQGNAVDVDGLLPNEARNNWRFGDCRRRTYRLAVAATGEYTAFHGGTVALAQAAQVTTINRVVGILEREMAIRLVLVSNNNLLIYTNAATDPYTNGTPGTMINENQTNTTTVIGSANYDIGHVFGTNSGGLAGLGVVCNNTNKARGVTGSAAPIGDPFDVDYVAHEMGHQFGANHTFNNSCNGNRNAGTAFETGSGITIMAYAGICAPNVQNAGTDNYHAASLNEIANLITNAGHTCPATATLANTTPAITTPSGATAYSIPISTPFFLTATATDPDANILSYSWEQMNNQISTQAPVATATVGPNFRAYSPTTNPTRYFPRLQDLATGAATTWEVLPSVARTMNFQVTVRDNAVGGGCTAQASLSVTTVATAGPFVVTAPNNTGLTWAGATNQTVTWNVAGTTASPISCANVNILLSTDGGLTYPIVLASNTPNDGTQVIIAPNLATTTARVQVVCANNIFFDISNNNFTITAATNDYSFAMNPTTVSVCPPASATYTANVGVIGTFSNAVTLTTMGLPAGLTATFSPSTVLPNNSSALVVSGTNNVAAGTYFFNAVANSSTGTKTVQLTLVVAAGAPTTVNLTTPANAATGVSSLPSFSWTASAGTGIVYQIDISTSPSFSPIIATASGITATNHSISTTLSNNTTYYWRVRASNSCATGGFSPAFSFTTNNITCYTFNSTNLPQPISAAGVSTAVSTVAIPSFAGTITDVNVTNLVGTHAYIQDLVVRLSSPAATNVTLFRRICAGEDNFNVKFDDIAAAGALPCPPVGGGTYLPNTLLSAFNGQSATGVWTLTITDSADVDGGQLTAWGIEVCIAAPICNLNATAVVTSNYNGLDISCSGAADGVAVVTAASGTTPYTYLWSMGNRTTATVTGLAAGTYFVTTTDAVGCTTADTVVLTQPNPMIVNATVDNQPLCFGSATGAARATVGGGTGGYTFIWSNGMTGGIATALVAGVYMVTAIDANNCMASGMVTLNQPSGLSVTRTSTNITCNSQCTGAISLTAAGGVSPYTYTWPNSLPAISSNTGLCAGTYITTITDANGCALTSSSSITQPAALSAVATNTNIACNAQCNATATVAASGGVSPYMYFWVGSGRTTNTSTGLCAGTYIISVTDANNCRTTSAATITQPSAITAVAVGTNISCALNDGSANVSASGGTAVLTYRWTNNATTTNITGLSQGVYNVTITDASACQVIRTATVGNGCTATPCTMTAIVSGNNATCNGVCNGVGVATAVNNTGAINYLWSNGSNGSTAANLCAGVYTVTATDANNCTATANVTINEPSALTVTISSTSVTCNNQCDGTAIVTVIGGTSPYIYLWNNGQSTQTATGICPGTFGVTIIDSNGCRTMAIIQINQPSALVAVVTANNTTCALNDGSASLSPSGGVGNYTYRWSNNATTATIAGLSQGVYNVTLTDGNGCQTTSDVTIGNGCTVVPCALTVTTTQNNITCFGQCNGLAAAIVNNGTAPISLTWSNANTGSTIASLCAGTYTVTATDGAGCTATASAIINQPAPLVATIVGNNNATCSGGNGSATSIVSGGTGNISLLWSPSGRTSATATGLNAGTQTLRATDANGCTATTSATIGLNYTLVVNSLVVNQNPTCFGANNGIATVTASGASPISYRWVNGQTNAQATNLSAGQQGVTVTTAGGCTQTLIATLTQPTALQLSFAFTLPTSAVATDGTITAVANNGSQPYSFVWSNGGSVAAISGLSAGSYRLTLTDANGCTRIDSVTLQVPSSVDANAQALQNISLSPNPAADNFDIVLAQPINEPFTVIIYDALGRVVYQSLEETMAQRLPISVIELPAATYFVRIVTSSFGQTTRKLLIVR